MDRSDILDQALALCELKLFSDCPPRQTIMEGGWICFKRLMVDHACKFFVQKVVCNLLDNLDIRLVTFLVPLEMTAGCEKIQLEALVHYKSHHESQHPRGLGKAHPLTHSLSILPRARVLSLTLLHAEAFPFSGTSGLRSPG
ncbi:hypothetical protein M5K25_004943 [Dendrobium thyrsiflorum]|uniref:Uncharacterized protein n=1 Tax=Dendrobium thyrsiflorum TaxID=117978 RepID=A0ABD0VGM8_DENTH